MTSAAAVCPPWVGGDKAVELVTIMPPVFTWFDLWVALLFPVAISSV